jgi:hypothetical protein
MSRSDMEPNTRTNMTKFSNVSSFASRPSPVCDSTNSNANSYHFCVQVNTATPYVPINCTYNRSRMGFGVSSTYSTSSSRATLPKSLRTKRQFQKNFSQQRATQSIPPVVNLPEYRAQLLQLVLRDCVPQRRPHDWKPEHNSQTVSMPGSYAPPRRSTTLR